MKVGFVLSLFSCILLFSSCGSQEPEQSGYSFFVAGHAYGKAIWGDMVAEPGMHPPFVAKLDYIKNRDDIELGFFTGDVVQSAEEDFWQKFDEQTTVLEFPIHIAPGNHDLKGPTPFVNPDGPLYKAISHNNDLYLILNTNNPAWMIDSTQIDFISEALTKHDAVRNIFVFAHHLLFWDKEGRFGSFEPNWFDDMPANKNFNDEVLPLFENSGDHVYFFFGDVGARDGMQLLYSNEGHHSFIASGMGGFESDNFLIVNVAADHSVDIEIVFLNDVGPDVPRRLKDYQWP